MSFDNARVEEIRRNAQDYEVAVWEDFLARDIDPAISSVLSEFLVNFKEGKFYEADEVILQSFKKLEAYPEVMQVFRSQFSMSGSYLTHPQNRMISKQLEIAERGKLKVGDIAIRYFSVVGHSDGEYSVSPTLLTKGDRGNYIVRVQPSRHCWSGWCAVHSRFSGIIVFCDEPQSPNWSAIRTKEVHHRSCVGEFIYVDFEKYVTDAVLAFHKEIGGSAHTKLKVFINW